MHNHHTRMTHKYGWIHTFSSGRAPWGRSGREEDPLGAWQGRSKWVNHSGQPTACARKGAADKEKSGRCCMPNTSRRHTNIQWYGNEGHLTGGKSTFPHKHTGVWAWWRTYVHRRRIPTTVLHRIQPAIFTLSFRMNSLDSQLHSYQTYQFDHFTIKRFMQNKRTEIKSSNPAVLCFGRFCLGRDTANTKLDTTIMAKFQFKSSKQTEFYVFHSHHANWTDFFLSCKRIEHPLILKQPNFNAHCVLHLYDELYGF